MLMWKCMCVYTCYVMCRGVMAFNINVSVQFTCIYYNMKQCKNICTIVKSVITECEVARAKFPCCMVKL